jgi:hypothetical protein
MMGSCEMLTSWINVLNFKRKLEKNVIYNEENISNFLTLQHLIFCMYKISPNKQITVDKVEFIHV